MLSNVYIVRLNVVKPRKPLTPTSRVGVFDVITPTGVALEPVDTIELAPTSVSYSRALWGEPFGTGVVCEAPDGITGAGEPGGECMACPQSTRKCKLSVTVQGLLECEGVADEPGVLSIRFTPAAPTNIPRPLQVAAQVLITAVQSKTQVSLRASTYETQSGMTLGTLEVL